VKRVLAIACLASLVAAPAALGDILEANAASNNGGSANWAIFFDLTSAADSLNVTHMTTASNASAFATFNIEIFTRVGSGLGNPGPGPVVRRLDLAGHRPGHAGRHRQRHL